MWPSSKKHEALMVLCYEIRKKNKQETTKTLYPLCRTHVSFIIYNNKCVELFLAQLLNSYIVF